MSLVQRFFRFAATAARPRRMVVAGGLALALALPLPLAPQSASAQPDTVRSPYYNGYGYQVERHRGQRIYRHEYRPYRAYRPYRGYRRYRPYRPYYRPYPRYGSGVYFGYGGNGAAAAGIIGLATGLIAQQALTPQRYYAPPPRHRYRPAAWTPEWYAYCSRKYRSFNPRTGYYLAYSGRYRFCR